MAPTRPGVPPKPLEEAFEMGCAARRAEIKLLKGGRSIAASGATSVTAEADRTYRGGCDASGLRQESMGALGKTYLQHLAD